MAVKLRLKRMGMKKRPFYRIIVANSQSPRDGRHIDQLGYYDPLTEPPTVKLDEEKALLWLQRGAQPTEAVARFLEKSGVTERLKAQKAAARSGAGE